MSTVKIGNKKAFLLSPDTFVDGVFIDTDNVIETFNFTNGSFSYTASEDCFVSVPYTSNGNTVFKINGKSYKAEYDSNIYKVDLLLLKKGQILSLANAKAESRTATVYGIQRGSASENIGTVRELTYAEYNALSESEKMNGTEYYIKDINGDGQAFQPVIYSLDEREIGVWTDGKPLYEKTIDFGAIPNSTSKNVAHNISNLDKVVSFDGIMISSDSFETVPSGENSNFRLTANDTNVNVVTSATWNDWSSSFITLRYTKTTDTAGSGTWTPQGVPSVHYSTDEQIVGTWIDNQGNKVPLYEKTILCNKNSDNINTNILSDLNIAELVEGKWYTWVSSVYSILSIDYNVSTKLITNKPSSKWTTRIVVRYTKSS